MAEVKKFYYVNDPDIILKDTKQIANDPTARYLLSAHEIVDRLGNKLDKIDLPTEVQMYLQAGNGIHIEEVIGEDSEHTPHLVIKSTGGSGAATDLSAYETQAQAEAKYLKLDDIETKLKEKGFITQADLQPILDAIKALKGE